MTPTKEEIDHFTKNFLHAKELVIIVSPNEYKRLIETFDLNKENPILMGAKLVKERKL